MRNSSHKLHYVLTRMWPRIQRRWKSEKPPKPYQCPPKPEIVYDCGPDLQDRGICGVDPCNPTVCYPEPRVVIIGAGMAGLSAAARLTKRHINNYVILEACARPGGRIQSRWIGDIVAELGSSVQQENYSMHPIYAMSASEDPPRPGIPACEHSRGLFNRVVYGKLPYPPTVSAYYKFRQIEEEAAAIYCFGGSKQHGSLINFMSLRIQQELHEYPEEQQHDAARIMFGMAHTLNARCGTDTAMLCADSCGCFMNIPGGDVRVPLGLIGILAPILRQIHEGSIQYCKPVNCIYWGACQSSGCRAIVCTNDGEEFPADYVIITVSLGCLCANAVKMFCPALPASKMDAIRCLGFGHCNKIYMEYCRPFWYWQQTPLNFKFCRGELCCRWDWTRGITSIEIVQNSKHVMVCWVVGPEARMMEGLCDRDVAEGITDVLRMVTGDSCIPYPITILRSCWSSHPSFLGAYSFDFDCSDGSAQQCLALPLPGPSEPVPPILLFAGEATVSGHCATVAGARLSGIREAERITQLTNLYQGPPIPVLETIKPLKMPRKREAAAEN